MTKFFENLLSSLKTTIYGREMRQLIHDAFKEIGETMLTPSEVDSSTSIGILQRNGTDIYPKTVPEAIMDVSGENAGKSLVFGDDGKVHPSDTAGLTQEDKELILSLFDKASYFTDEADAVLTKLRNKWTGG